jgi:hypothetical protein
VDLNRHAFRIMVKQLHHVSIHTANDRFGSLAALQSNTSLMSAFGGKALIQLIRKLLNRPSANGQ